MSIKKYLKKGHDVKLFQGRLDSSLYQKLLVKLKSDKIQHREFLEAAVRAYLDEK